MADCFNLVKNRLVNDYKNTIRGVVFFALMIFIANTLVPIVCTLCGNALSEMNAFTAGLYQLFAKTNKTALDKIFIFVETYVYIIEIVIVVVCVYLTTKRREKEFKNKMIMGASQMNIICEALIENVVVFILGVVVGLLFSCIGIAVAGKIIESSISMLDIVSFISMLVILFVVIVFTIIPILWIDCKSKDEPRKI